MCMLLRAFLLKLETIYKLYKDTKPNRKDDMIKRNDLNTIKCRILKEKY